MFPNFKALDQAMVQGLDYEIKNRYGSGNYQVHLAIHGGNIEPGTTQLAAYCSGDDAFYSFEGMGKFASDALLIDAVDFDEPFALANTLSAQRAVSWHGTDDLVANQQITYVSGLDTALAGQITQYLHAAGFATDRAPAGFTGENSLNLVNRTATGRGVQLTLSESLREAFFKNGDLSRPSITKPENRLALFFTYCDAVRSALADLPLTPAPQSAVDRTLMPPAPRPDPNISVAPAIPFSIDHSGGLTLVSDSFMQLSDRVRALVSTQPGERVMRRTFGVATAATLFAVSAETAQAQIQQATLEAVARWEPEARVRTVAGTPNFEQGVVNVQVSLSRPDMPQAEAREVLRTVGVHVGGTSVSLPE